MNSSLHGGARIRGRVQAALAEPGQQLLECAGTDALLAIQLRQTKFQQVNGTACLPDTVRVIRGTATAGRSRFPNSRSVHDIQHTQREDASGAEEAQLLHGSRVCHVPDRPFHVSDFGNSLDEAWAEGSSKAASKTNRGVPTTPGNDHHPQCPMPLKLAPSVPELLGCPRTSCSVTSWSGPHGRNGKWVRTVQAKPSFEGPEKVRRAPASAQARGNVAVEVTK